ncbi:MAG TPA: complex I NDUFA9 subunit family protein [Actinomycetota bacterium]|nr:complex I NDUFA9 subunit family protein [Actinomycetota bacterium]
MNVVVAGGTGFIGRHVARALLDGGHRVTVMTRDESKVAGVPELQGAAAVRADVTDPRTLTGTLAGADAVVGCVQFPNHPVEVPRKGLTYDRYDRQGTENLVAEAVDAGVRRYFYMSGAGADPRSSVVWYRAKGRAEEIVRRSGLEWAALRPSWAYGPQDRALNKFVFMARYLPVVLQVGVKPQRVQPVWVGDVALAVRRTFEREDAWSTTYEIGGPDVMTMNEIIHTMLDVMGKRRLVVPIPTVLAKAGTAPLRLLPNPPMTPQGIEFATQSGIVDTRLVRERLGVQAIGLREGLAGYL